MTIRQFEQKDLPTLLRLWNRSVEAGEVVYRPLTEDYYRAKFEGDPNHDPRYILVAEDGGEVVGYIHGLAKKVFLPKETNENTPGFVTVVFVDAARRRQGVGAALLAQLTARFAAAGKQTIAVSGMNPLNIDWLIPGTPGHDHNNAPGADMESQGYPFFLAQGFEERHREVAMYLNLSDYERRPEVDEKRARLAAEGIYTGRYNTNLNYDYDGMCDRVRSEYWRSAISAEIAAWKTGRPVTDIRFLPNGKVPEGPRPMLVAAHAGKIVGFTGPVDKQASGRGFFTGICTDPLYEKRGIATVLFNLLMWEFVQEGATFSTLFTGDAHHAQRLYEHTGFRVVRRFALMGKAIG